MDDAIAGKVTMSSYQPTVYGRVIYWERPLQVVSNQFVRPGDTVLDVGSNTGGLAIAFARRVGKQGRVLAFEANPAMAEWIKSDIQANACGNIEVIARAAYSRAGEQLPFYIDNSYYSSGSSLTANAEGWTATEVVTTTVDAECEKRSLSPTLIKIDVEGAELSVLQGAQNTLRRSHPIVIFEAIGEHGDRAFEWLRGFGSYDFFDINTLESYTFSPNEPFPINILAVPRRPRYLPFSRAAVKRRHVEIVPAESDLQTIRVRMNKPGVYVIEALTRPRSSGMGKLELSIDDDLEAFFHAEVEQLAHRSCSSFPVQLRSSAKCRLHFTALGDTAALDLLSAKVTRVFFASR